MIFDEDKNSLAHYGTKRHSGRYPWGSGENPEERGRTFIGYVNELKKQGLSDTEIVKEIGLESTTQLRARRTISKNAIKAADIAQARKLQEKQYSNVQIGKMMTPPRNESSVRDLLNPATKDKNDQLKGTVDMLKNKISDTVYVDVGAGTGNHINVSKEHLKVAVQILQEEGYKLQYRKVPQVFGAGKETTVKALTLPTTTNSEFYHHPDRVQILNVHTPDGGKTYETEAKPPKSLSSRRIQVRYGSEGGSDMDGVIQLRRGVKDLDMGQSKYAQVRILVDGTHYLKGMAMYADDLPTGVDVRFNTNKSKGGSKLDALKPIKIDKETGQMDKDLPFGAVIKVGGQRGVLNIVNEEGDWDKWSKTLSAQMLSKQTNSLAKEQLALKYKSQLAEFDEIKKLTNPAVRKALLEKFADSADSSAVHLKAAALPRQRTQAILPITSMKTNEVYAPNFKNGEHVVLVRYPHGGKFEIPGLTVNNRNKEALSVLHQARDAIGIHPKVAERLSGADFDGDTVLVIPNPHGKIKTSAPLDGLKNFDPKKDYAPYDGMRTIDGGVYRASTKSVDYGGKTPDPRNKQRKMGDVSNLITDMTIKGAEPNEIAHAVRHSMVVIDADKHMLNYAQSYKDNNISKLKADYQGSSRAGAATLISRKKSDTPILDRKARPADQGGPIDVATGKKMFVGTGRKKLFATVDPVTGKKTYSEFDKNGKTELAKIRISKLAATDDAFTLVSDHGGTVIEHIYATHSNKLKVLANDARKEANETPNAPYNKSANKIYTPQVKSLDAKLSIAERNKPLERNAQIFANETVRQKKAANPHMEKSDLKKIESKALTNARLRIGAGKIKIDIEQDEWNAIQAGAISNSKLRAILLNTDDEVIKKFATPRTAKGLSIAKKNYAIALLANGYTQQEVAEQVGVPLGTLQAAIYEKG